MKYKFSGLPNLYLVVVFYAGSDFFYFFYFRLLVARAAGGARGVPRSANVRTGGSAIPPTGVAAVPLDTAA